MPLLSICPLVPSMFMSHFLLKPVVSTQCCSLFQDIRPSAEAWVHSQHQHLWMKLAPSFSEAIKCSSARAVASWFLPSSVFGFCLVRSVHVVTATVDSYVQLAWHVQKTLSHCRHATPLSVISFCCNDYLSAGKRSAMLMYYSGFNIQTCVLCHLKAFSNSRSSTLAHACFMKSGEMVCRKRSSFMGKLELMLHNTPLRLGSTRQFV